MADAWSSVARGRSRLGLTFALSVLVVAACAGVAGSQGDPAAPVLVTGRVVDASGNPVSGARLQLSILDYEHSELNQPVPVVFSETYSANLDGTFALHLAPTPAIAAKGETNGGFVNFDLVVLASDTSFITAWGFPRELSGPGWAGEIPTVVLAPLGSGPNNPPGVPAPLPAET